MKTVYNTSVIDSNVATKEPEDTENTDVDSTKATAAKQVTDVSSPTAATVNVPDSTQSNSVDQKQQQIEAIMKQRELLAAEVILNFIFKETFSQYLSFFIYERLLISHLLYCLPYFE